MTDKYVRKDFTDFAGFHEKQKEAWYQFMDPQCKYLLYGGAMAGGKSYLLRWSAVGLLMYFFKVYGKRGVPVGLFSEDYPTLKDRQVLKMETEFPPELGKLKDDNLHGLHYRLNDAYGGGIILLRNLDDPSKYMSSEFAGVFVEELTKNEESTFRALRNRMRFPGIPEVKFMGATNPGGVGHNWVRAHFVDKYIPDDPEEKRFYYVHARVYDNLDHVPPDYVKQLESLPEKQRKAYLDGSWDVFEGQYFTVWNRNLHVCNPFIPSKESGVIVGGLDWGRVDNFSFHLSEVTRIDGEGTHFYRSKVFFEVYGKERTPAEWSQEIKSRLRLYNLTLRDISWVRADTQIWSRSLDGRSLDIYSQFVQEDPDWRLLKKADKDRVGGWENLQNWFSLAPDGLPYLQFASTAKNAIRLFPSLVHDENKREDVDQDGENDACDSVRYEHMSLKWIPGKSGVVFQPKQQATKPVYANFVSGKQQGVDLNDFADLSGASTGNYGSVTIR